MKLSKLLFFMLFLLGLFSCSDEEPYIEVETKFRNIEKNMNYEIKKITLPPENNTKSQKFPRVHDIANINSVDLLIMGQSKSLEFYDLSKNKLHKVIRLENILKEHNGKEAIKSIFFHNQDSIFLLTISHILIVNTAAQIVKKIDINFNKDGSMKKRTFNNIAYDFPMRFIPQDSCIYLHAFSAKYKRHSKKYYDEPIEYAININTEEIIDLPIASTKLYKEAFFGCGEFPRRIIRNTKHYYSFAYDSNIYVFDRKNLKKEIYGGRSSFHTEVINPLDSDLRFKLDKNMEYEFLNTTEIYSSIIYDEFRNVYYRFFITRKPEKGADGLFSTYDDRKFVLMVFDKNFNIIQEKVLTGGRYNYAGAFVTKNGLYIRPRNGVKDKIEYYLLKPKLI